jgi:hypothetical protein
VDITNCSVEVRSELKNYGRTEDGTPFIGEVYRVMVENERGDRWVHQTHFQGVRIEQWEEGPVYLDNRYEAEAAAAKLLRAVKHAGKINMDCWEETDPAYGSDAYLRYGAAADIQREKMEG